MNLEIYKQLYPSVNVIILGKNRYDIVDTNTKKILCVYIKDTAVFTKNNVYSESALFKDATEDLINFLKENDE